MKARLFKARVFDVPSLCQLDPRHARLIWRSVEGERFVRLLQGMDISIATTQRGGFGNGRHFHPNRQAKLTHWAKGTASAMRTELPVTLHIGLR